MAANTPTVSTFVSRRTPDGTINSICLRCFRTVHLGLKTDMAESEQQHVCKTSKLDLYIHLLKRGD